MEVGGGRFLLSYQGSWLREWNMKRKRRERGVIGVRISATVLCLIFTLLFLIIIGKLNELPEEASMTSISKEREGRGEYESTMKFRV